MEALGLKKDKKILIFIIAGVVGLLLLIFGGASALDGDGDDGEIGVRDPDVYAERIEADVKRICRSVAGESEVEVVVSLSGGYRSVFATDMQNTDSGYKNNTVLVGSGSNEGALLLCYENPEISGIGIVLSGEEDIRIKNEIISLVSSAFSVGTNKIYVSFSY